MSVNSQPDPSSSPPPDPPATRTRGARPPMFSAQTDPIHPGDPPVAQGNHPGDRPEVTGVNADSPGRLSPPSSPPPTTTSSPASTDRTEAADRVTLADARDYEDTIAAGFHALGDALNLRLSPQTDLFLTDTNDEGALARPLSRIAARRLPARMALAGVAGGPDLKDAITAGLVLARYALKQINLLRAYQRATAQTTTTPPADAA